MNGVNGHLLTKNKEEAPADERTQDRRLQINNTEEAPTEEHIKDTYRWTTQKRRLQTNNTEQRLT
jgi:hypothetical protein